MNMILYQVLVGISYALKLAYWLIVARAVLSWFMRPDQPIYALLIRITEPMIGPFRPLAYRLSKGRLPIDLAPLFAFLAITLLQRLVYAGMLRLW